MRFVCGAEVLAVKTEDGESEDELDEAEDEIEDENWRRGGGGGEGGSGFLCEAGEGHDFGLVVSEFAVWCFWNWLRGWSIVVRCEGSGRFQNFWT